MRTVRPVIFWLHLTIGCVAGVVILIMSVTGVLLAYERQIENWANAPYGMEGRATGAAPAPLDSILAALTNGGPGAPSQLIVHRSVHMPLEARYGRDRTLYVDPITAEVVGQPSMAVRKFFGTVEDLHRSMGLGMQNAFGRGIAGAGNLIFLFILISGSYLWLPKAFNAASLKMRLLFQRGLKGKALEWNWHHVIGIWCVIPLFIIVLSGVIMSYPWASNLLFTMTGSPVPVRGGGHGDHGGPGGPPGQDQHQGFGGPAGQDGPRGAGHHQNFGQMQGLARSEQPGMRGEQQPGGGHMPGAGGDATAPTYKSLDELVALAKQTIPGWKSISISIPRPSQDSLNLSIDTSSGGHPEASTQLMIDRQSGRVLSVKDFRDNSLGQKLRAWARFLHTGEEFGVWGETIAALVTLGAVFLVWTGYSMAIRRGLAACTRDLKIADSAEDKA